MARSSPTRDRGYPTLTYPDCARVYSGPNAGTGIFAVGRNTEFERFFPRSEMAEAEAWAKENRAHLENLPTSALCHDLVIVVYGR